MSFGPSVFNPLGWEAFQVIAQKWCLSDYNTESSTSGWLARRPSTWRAASATPYRQARLPQRPVQSEMFWLDYTPSYLNSGRLFVCVRLMTAAQWLSLIKAHSVVDAGAGWRCVGMLHRQCAGSSQQPLEMIRGGCNVCSGKSYLVLIKRHLQGKFNSQAKHVWLLLTFPYSSCLCEFFSPAVHLISADMSSHRLLISNTS